MIGNKWKKKQTEIDNLIEESKEPTDTEGLLKLCEQCDKEKKLVDAILEEAEACNDGILDIKNEMGECQIPENITRRANEIDTFKEKLIRISTDFFDFKIDYAESSNLSADTKVEIKKLIDEIDKMIYGFDQEKKEFFEF